MNSAAPQKRSSSSTKIRVEFKGTPFVVKRKSSKPAFQKPEESYDAMMFRMQRSHRKTPSLDQHTSSLLDFKKQVRARNISFQHSAREESKQPNLLRKVGGDLDALQDDDDFLPADEGIAFNPLSVREKPSPVQAINESPIVGPVTKARHKKLPSAFIMPAGSGRNQELKKIRSLSRESEGLQFFNSRQDDSGLNVTLQRANQVYQTVGTPNSSRQMKSFSKHQGASSYNSSFITNSSHSSLFSKSYVPSLTSTRSKVSAKSPRDFALLQRPGTTEKIQKYSFATGGSKQEDNVILRFSYSTKPGMDHQKQPKDNQDSMIINPKLKGNRIMHLFGVCDGHGKQGKKASEYVQINLTRNIVTDIKELTKSGPIETAPESAIIEILHTAVIKTNEEVVNAPFDTIFSGTTCCAIFFLGRKLYTINVGDSRAIVVKQLSGQYIAKPLTKDHKPDDFEEQKRIVASGGKVQPFFDLATNEYCGPQRVYNLKGEVPGLAMSRSIGDEIAKRYGVIAAPTIQIYELQPQDKYIVIGSDGIWEFLDNQRVADISSQYMKSSDAESAVKSVMTEARKAWKKNEEAVIDDITCVILQLGFQTGESHFSETSTMMAQL